MENTFDLIKFAKQLAFNVENNNTHVVEALSDELNKFLKTNSSVMCVGTDSKQGEYVDHKLYITKGELVKTLVPYKDTDQIVIAVDDCVLMEDHYGFAIDPINMGLDYDGNDRGYEIQLCPKPYMTE